MFGLAWLVSWSVIGTDGGLVCDFPVLLLGTNLQYTVSAGHQAANRIMFRGSSLHSEYFVYLITPDNQVRSTVHARGDSRDLVIQYLDGRGRQVPGMYVVLVSDRPLSDWGDAQNASELSTRDGQDRPRVQPTLRALFRDGFSGPCFTRIGVGVWAVTFHLWTGDIGFQPET